MEKFPSKFLNYNESIDFLYSLQFHGIKLGLENSLAFADLLGVKHIKNVIHIAGTNGKGSTCKFIHSMLMEHGYNVGIFTSPHIMDFRERICFNSKMISKSFITGFLNKYSNFIWEKQLTFFEVNTIMALAYFKEKKPDYIILETGMGGRLDATNICKPILTAITNISLDHTEFLGNSIEEIAEEKAGIIKKNVPLFTSEVQKTVLNIFLKRCEELDSVVVKIEPHKKISENEFIYQNKRFRSPLLGEHQFSNIKLAYELVSYLLEDKLSFTQMENSLSRFSWPGRIETWSADTRVILDVSHNPVGIKRTVESLISVYPTEKFLIIFSSLTDKDWSKNIEILKKLSSDILFYFLDHNRQDKKIAAKYIEKSDMGTFNKNKSLNEVLLEYEADKLLVIGSHYLLEDFLNNYK